ncbi:MAG: hypothetical protein ABFS56_17785 [Pseudomonadota bacterium]
MTNAERYHPDVLTPEQNAHSRKPEVVAKYRANAEELNNLMREAHERHLLKMQEKSSSSPEVI